MNLRQMVAGREPPVTSDAVNIVHLLDRAVLAGGVPHPDHCGQVRGVPGEPGIGVVLGGPRLSGRRPADFRRVPVPDRTFCSRHVVDVSATLRSIVGWTFVAVLRQHLAVRLDDLQDRDRVGPVAPLGEGRVGPGHLQRGHVGCAESQGAAGVDPRDLDTRFARNLDEFRRSDHSVHDLGVDGVDRAQGRSGHVHVAELRCPRSSTPSMGFRPCSGIGRR